MDAATYQTEQDALFAEWEEKLKRDIAIALDGAVDPEPYFRVDRRPQQVHA